jgi:predicted MPP superfamily phosphohydrolase
MPLLFSQIFIFVIPLIIVIYSLINAQITVIEEETIIYPGYTDSIRIMHISDMHLGAIYQKGSVENVVELINEKKPDVVAITGDISDGSLPVNSDWLEPFNKVSDNIEVLYVTGNHESLYGKSDILNEIKKIEKIRHIGDNEEIIYIKGFQFIGLDYEYKDVKEKVKSIINKYGVNYKISPTVFLYHVPNISLKDLNEIGIYLALMGHTHGGQFFPFTIYAWIISKYLSGLYNNENKNYIYVSSGYGTVWSPIRNLCSKSIGLITIKGD